jgi:hypothetical protein
VDTRVYALTYLLAEMKKSKWAARPDANVHSGVHKNPDAMMVYAK